MSRKVLCECRRWQITRPFASCNNTLKNFFTRPKQIHSRARKLQLIGHLIFRCQNSVCPWRASGRTESSWSNPTFRFMKSWTSPANSTTVRLFNLFRSGLNNAKSRVLNAGCESPSTYLFCVRRHPTPLLDENACLPIGSSISDARPGFYSE